MTKSLFFIVRITAAWIAVSALFFGMTLEPLFGHTSVFNHLAPVFFTLLGLFVASTAFSHVRRVRLISSDINLSTLSNRQRRQIEVPYDAGVAFSMIDAAIRELPGCEEIDGAPGSLQIRAKIRRINPYAVIDLPGKLGAHFGPLRNQIMAIVTPNGDASSITLICEAEHAGWADWLLVDHGTNLENAQALGRAIAQQVAARRRAENQSVEQTITQTITEKELTTAKLNLLQAQVEPHFLYNTLASAQLLTRTDPARADIMLGNLILYLRHSLPRAGDGMSTLGVELERSRAYLDILKIRMGQRLSLQIDVPDNLHNLPMPSMMLQTLVENGIKHGLEPKPGGGTIWILARQTTHNGAASVALTVADDGRGFSSEGGGTGLGLKNVRERLQLQYGSQAGFSIVANFPNGVAATITLPAAESGSDNKAASPSLAKPSQQDSGQDSGQNSRQNSRQDSRQDSRQNSQQNPRQDGQQDSQNNPQQGAQHG